MYMMISFSQIATYFSSTNPTHYTNNYTQN